MDAFIKAISYYLPKPVITNVDLALSFPNWPAEKIAQKVGVSERHISLPEESAGDMAVKAAEILFQEYCIDKNCIDFLILCTQSPDYVLPSTSCVIQHRLGLKNECGAFDINLGCSGYTYCLTIAKCMICSGVAKNVLLLTSDTYSKYLNPDDRGCRTIFGDGASATLVSTSGHLRIGKSFLGTDGSGADKIIVREKGEYLNMDGPAVFEFAALKVPELINNLLKEEGKTLESINLYIFHQANKYMINYLRKLIGIEKEHFYIYLDKVGNTVSSSIPIALCEAYRDGLVKGDIMLVGFGVGFSYGAILLSLSE